MSKAHLHATNAPEDARRTSYVLGFEELDRSAGAVVGGKGAHLGELSRLDGIHVPAGFCVTTLAFQRMLAEAPTLARPLDLLSRLTWNDREAIGVLSAELRRTLAGTAIPSELAAAVAHAHARLGEQAACAVRSSATAEDLPAASFAGQQDTILNVVGLAAVLRSISQCWASLFTERAVTYRLRRGFDHRKVQMAVVVQKMVFPHAAGVLFTADPVTGNRKVTSVEASFGLGESLVSGLVNADAYKVRDGMIVARAIGCKQLAVNPSPMGGTLQQPIAPELQREPALTDPQVLQLAQLGRRIEAHFGAPQDIEWCLADEAFHIVQSRPITTLFPIPEAGDEENHVYVSVGHAQMMTDPMKPLGLSMWQLTTQAPMAEAAGRLFVDVTKTLASPISRVGLLAGFRRSDPLSGDALETIVAREDFLPASDGSAPSNVLSNPPEPIETNAAIVTGLIEQNQASVEALKHEIRGKTGTELFDFILDDLQELRRLLFDPRNLQAIMAAVQSTWWLKDHLDAWLGDKNAADLLTQSAPGNVSSEMGLALLEVADTIRPCPQVVAFLEDAADDDRFLDNLGRLDGGQAARDAIQAFLDQYGMRCVGEIDITRPRWAERPGTLVPIILGNVKNLDPGAGPRRFELGRQRAAATERDVLERLRALLDGDCKAEETKRMIDRVRTFIGYREYPKYGWICRYFVYKQALLEEAGRLTRAGALRDPDDIAYLRFDELREVARTHHLDEALIEQRKDAFKSYEALTPPRVLTSDGEVITGAYQRDDLPEGALVGLAVSAGRVEGRARVIANMGDARLEPGDILVTTHTDPSWSPLFLTIAGLVTEVGGLMTHGAVVAREYGLPAVVGVVDATRLIKDGQRLRVHGTNGYVEILP